MGVPRQILHRQASTCLQAGPPLLSSLRSGGATRNNRVTRWNKPSEFMFRFDPGDYFRKFARFGSASKVCPPKMRDMLPRNHSRPARRGLPCSARVSDPAETADRRSPPLRETFSRPGWLGQRPATTRQRRATTRQRRATARQRPATTLRDRCDEFPARCLAIVICGTGNQRSGPSVAVGRITRTRAGTDCGCGELHPGRSPRFAPLGNRTSPRS